MPLKTKISVAESRVKTLDEIALSLKRGDPLDEEALDAILGTKMTERDPQIEAAWEAWYRPDELD